MKVMRLVGVLAAIGATAFFGCSSVSNKAANPCELLTIQDISREVGNPVTGGGLIKSDSDHSTGCSYGVTGPDGTAVGDVQLWIGRDDQLYNALTQQGADLVPGSKYSTLSLAMDRVPDTDVAISRRANDFVVVYAYGHMGAAARIADLAASKLLH